MTAPRSGESIVDLGCGTGKQLCQLAHAIGVLGIAVGFDLSSSSLHLLLERARNQHLSNLGIIRSDFNSLNIFRDRLFDIVLSCFSIYEAKDPGPLMEEIWRKLKAHGRCFICGPDENNNSELIEFCERIMQTAPSPSIQRMKAAGEEVRKTFRDFVIERFENRLIFTFPEQLVEYWKAYYLYDEAYEQAFIKAVNEHFARNRRFVTSKRVVGFLGKK